MLKPHEDATGRALLDGLHAPGGVEIVERDDGYIQAQPLLPYFDVFADWPTRQRRAMRHARGRVLDVGAGAGRCALYLASRGQDTVCIDNSPLACEVARRRGVQRAEVRSVTEVSRALGTFDTVLMMGNNLALLGGERRARWLLRRFRAVTGVHGRIVGEVVDPYRTDDPAHLAYHDRNRRRGRMPGQLRLRIRYRQYASPWFDYLFVSPAELRGLLNGTGWALADVIDVDEPAYVAVLEREP